MIITIKKKRSRTGSIYDIASDQEDIDIVMKKNHLYVVVSPAFFNIQPTQHKTLEAAVIKRRKLGVVSVILDREGYIIYVIDVFERGIHGFNKVYKEYKLKKHINDLYRRE